MISTTKKDVLGRANLTPLQKARNETLKIASKFNVPNSSPILFPPILGSNGLAKSTPSSTLPKPKISVSIVPQPPKPRHIYHPHPQTSTAPSPPSKTSPASFNATKLGTSRSVSYLPLENSAFKKSALLEKVNRLNKHQKRLNSSLINSSFQKPHPKPLDLSAHVSTPAKKRKKSPPPQQ
ncbi:hypothetical protein AYI68_g4893 [Smittium mucronatum]|uniref:Uncharacterized protein n=1 Tax=Smittium mucronatum TaxID=133383 RepID=A0A1R0GVW5_9FUNG|nr:hypothetical protein AYI68_g4893 [Smittium mucronatum]